MTENEKFEIRERLRAIPQWINLNLIKMVTEHDLESSIDTFTIVRHFRTSCDELVRPISFSKWISNAHSDMEKMTCYIEELEMKIKKLNAEIEA